MSEEIQVGELVTFKPNALSMHIGRPEYVFYLTWVMRVTGYEQHGNDTYLAYQVVSYDQNLKPNGNLYELGWKGKGLPVMFHPYQTKIVLVPEHARWLIIE
jgi:hypothetical protein